MQATTTGKMAGQPSVLAAAGALLIATAIVVGVALAQQVQLGSAAPVAGAAPLTNQAVQDALTQVRQGEKDGLAPGWAGAVVETYRPQHPAGNVGISGGGGYGTSVRPELGPGSPSYSELVDQRRGEKFRITTDSPDAIRRGGAVGHR